ncbi:MAG: kynureninase [Glaciecola sp.]|jgi:kynureninase
MSPLLASSMKPDFGRFLEGGGDRLHVAAHSHHPWPDVTFDAQQQAWLDAAKHHDDKWQYVQGSVIPAAQAHIARELSLPDPSSIVFAPNTHEFVARLLSCFEGPIRVLTSDAEFHAFRRQVDRLAEDGLIEIERVAAEPLETFTDRFVAAAAAGGHDLVFFSSVHFNSGHVVTDIADIVDAVPDEKTFIAIDGYHQFMAMPTDLSSLADRVFFLAGGYKYAMAGEGACFMHVPPGYGMRPGFTGWYAEYGELDQASGQQVSYAKDATRFAGSTFDPSGIYRLVAVQDWLVSQQLTSAHIHSHVAELQAGFLERVGALTTLPFGLEQLTPGLTATDRGNFVTFRFDRAAEMREALAIADVMVDHRGDRLRFGFGIYHDRSDLDVLAERIELSCELL